MMKPLLILAVFLAPFVQAKELPSARLILAAARMQLPSDPIHMEGTLQERAPNGFVRRSLTVEMDLHWSAEIPHATYQIKDPKKGDFQTLKIRWLPDGPTFKGLKNGAPISNFNPHAEIEHLGVTWADLSFSFLWNPDAQTLRTGKKLGRECYVIAIPRPENHSLWIWVAQKEGRLLGATEQDAAGKTHKIIKVVSVKEFDGFWMVKDLDIIHPKQKKRTSLRIDHLERISDAEKGIDSSLQRNVEFAY